jgi:dephospho-CoA kinase
MGAIQQENLSRTLLGNSAQLFLYSSKPEKYPQQILNTQSAVTGIVQALFNTGRQNEVIQSIGPLLFSSLRPSIPHKSSLANYLDTIAVLEPEKENQTVTELISSFDNIIILLGKKASGKGTVSEMLNRNYGFPNMPTSDWLRAIAAARGNPEPFDPVMLRDLGDELRQEFGGEVLVWLTLQEYALKGDKSVVFDGLRSEVEMSKLMDKKNVSFIWVDAPDEKRLERVKGRARAGDPQTLDDLYAVDAKSFPEADKLKELCQIKIDNPEDDYSILAMKTDLVMQNMAIAKPERTVIG